MGENSLLFWQTAYKKIKENPKGGINPFFFIKQISQIKIDSISAHAIQVLILSSRQMIVILILDQWDIQMLTVFKPQVIFKPSLLKINFLSVQ